MDDILPAAKELLHEVSFDEDHKIRLIGLSVSNPKEEIEDTEARWIEQDIRFE